LRRRRRGGRLTFRATTVATAILLVAACSSTPGPSTTAIAVVATPTATVASMSNPTLVAASTTAPTPTPTCAVTVDHTPTINVKFNLSGTAFAPGIDVLLTVGKGPPFNGRGSQIHPPGLHTASDGTFGPYEMFYDAAEPVGPHSITVSDGSCQATVSFTLTKP
jgi:hypothetical protein